MGKHPLQKPYIDEQGTHRFTENTIVQHLLKQLEVNRYTLNEIAHDCHDHSPADWDQFNQLIGYSLSGCPYRDDSLFDVASEMLIEGMPEAQARAECAEALIASMRAGMRESIAGLYQIHPADLCPAPPPPRAAPPRPARRWRKVFCKNAAKLYIENKSTETIEVKNPGGAHVRILPNEGHAWGLIAPSSLRVLSYQRPQVNTTPDAAIIEVRS